MDYKDIIDAKGIKQSFIAKQMGISRAFLSMMLNGKRKIPENRVQDLHKILGLK